MHVVRAERLSVLRDEVGALRRVLSRFRWQLGFERLLLFGVRGLMGCAVAAIGLAVAAWLMPGSELLSSGDVWLVALPGVAALGLGLLRWPSDRQAALAADRRLLLDERLGTAVELAVRVRAQVSPAERDRAWVYPAQRSGAWATSGRFDRLQIRDAIEQAGRAPGGWLALDRRVRRDALGALVLSVLAAGSLLLPNLPRPSMLGANQTASLVEPGQADTEQRALSLDAPEPAVADAQPVQPQTRPAPDLAARVQQGQAERTALDALSQALGQVSAAQPAVDAIQQGDFSAAKRQLSTLGEDADQLSGAAKQQLASALQQAASASTTADRQLADRERQAAQALSRNNYADQRQALRNLADQVERSGGRSVPADQLARDTGQLQQQQQQQKQTGAQGPGGQAAGAAAGANAAAGQQPGAKGAAGQQPGAQGAAGQQPGAKGAAGQQPGAQGAAGEGGQQTGAGIDTGAGGDPLSDTPSRLESAGQRVAVPLILGNGSGVRPPDGTEDQTGNDPTAGARSVSEQAHAQQTGQVASEQNLVPSEQRPVVRGYFQ